MKDHYRKKMLSRKVGITIRSFLNKGGDSSCRLTHIMLSWILSVTLVISIVGISANTAQAETSMKISEGDDWHYFTGNAPPPRHWNHIGFDDSSWQRGRSGFGYGSHGPMTSLEGMRGSHKRVYVRKEFAVNAPQTVHTMTLSVLCDGPFIAYLNGIEVLRNKVGMSVPEQAGGNGQPVQIDISGFAHELHLGINVVSFQCENDDVDSDDFNFVPFFEVIEK